MSCVLTRHVFIYAKDKFMIFMLLPVKLLYIQNWQILIKFDSKFVNVRLAGFLFTSPVCKGVLCQCADYGYRTFRRRTFHRRAFRRRTFCRTDISPYEHFAVRTLYRKDISPWGHFAVRLFAVRTFRRKLRKTVNHRETYWCNTKLWTMNRFLDITLRFYAVCLWVH